MDREQLKQSILKSLGDRPGAGDTLQGIARVWVLDNSEGRDEADLKAALEELVAEGRLKVENPPSSTDRIYSLNEPETG